MKRWSVSFDGYASAYVEVEAETEEEAEDKAVDALGYPELCHYCSRSIELGDSWEISGTDELDEEED